MPCCVDALRSSGALRRARGTSGAAGGATAARAMSLINAIIELTPLLTDVPNAPEQQHSLLPCKALPGSVQLVTTQRSNHRNERPKATQQMPPVCVSNASPLTAWHACGSRACQGCIPSVLQAASTSFPQVSEGTGLRRHQCDGSGHADWGSYSSEPDG